jgi:aspartyl-tRNA(Asn)/glutamyl-tRNA(Gln) amidotransferase subunit A
MAGEPGRVLPDIGVSGLRLLLPLNIAFANIDADVEHALDRAVARLHNAGALIDRRALAAFDQINEAHAKGGFAATEAYAWHRVLLAAHADRYDPRVASRILPGGDMSGADYFLLAQARARIIAQFDADMSGYDAMMLPTVPIAPPRISDFETDAEYRRLNFLLLRNSAAVNFLDGCAISLPCHAAGRPPAGLMLVMPAMHDARLLGLALAVERACSRGSP